MKKIHFTYLCCLSAIIGSCTDADTMQLLLEESNEGLPKIEVTGKQRLSAEAISIVSEFRSSHSTRSPNSEEILVDYVLSSDVITDTSIQEQMVDTMLYVLNVNDSDGFYLVSGDRALPDIVGYSDSGHFYLNSQQANEINSLILNLYANYYLESFDDPIEPIRPTDPWLPPVTPWHPDTVVVIRDYIEYSPWTVLNSIPPMVPVEWHQGYPFNARLIDAVTNIRYVAGCVPIAVSQLLTYYRRPTGSFMNYTINDWDLITGSIPSNIYGPYPNQYVSDVSALVQWVCDGVNCTYGYNSTTAYMSAIPPFLSTAGFSHPSSVCPYDSTALVQSIWNEHPVIVFGTDRADGNVGHAWIVDGLKREYRIRTWRNTYWGIIEESYEYRMMLHCNWGMQYSPNGYYLEGIFDVDHSAPNPDTDADGYYRYNMTMIPEAY